MSFNFSHTNPPSKRKRRIDGTFIMITEDKNWVQGVEVYEWTQSGCTQNPENGTYYTDDSLTITISDGKIQSISQTAT